MSCLISLWIVVTKLSRLTECCNVYCIYAFIHYSHFCCHCTGWKILVGTDHFSSLEHQDDKIFFFLRRCSNQANFCSFILFTLLMWVCISYLFYVNLRKRSCYSTLFPLIHINTLDFSLKPNVVYWLCFYFLLMFCYLKKKTNVVYWLILVFSQDELMFIGFLIEDFSTMSMMVVVMMITLSSIRTCGIFKVYSS